MQYFFGPRLSSCMYYWVDILLCVLLFQVLYETHGFLEKNRDFLHSDLLQLLASCDCVLAQLFAASIGDGVQKMQSPTRRVNSAESQKQSVATKFKVCAT